MAFVIVFQINDSNKLRISITFCDHYSDSLSISSSGFNSISGTRAIIWITFSLIDGTILDDLIDFVGINKAATHSTFCMFGYGYLFSSVVEFSSIKIIASCWVSAIFN